MDSILTTLSTLEGIDRNEMMVGFYGRILCSARLIQVRPYDQLDIIIKGYGGMLGKHMLRQGFLNKYRQYKDPQIYKFERNLQICISFNLVMYFCFNSQTNLGRAINESMSYLTKYRPTEPIFVSDLYLLTINGFQIILLVLLTKEYYFLQYVHIVYYYT